ncbi:MAG: hypothetical protein WCJ81_07620 [bacterium]
MEAEILTQFVAHHQPSLQVKSLVVVPSEFVFVTQFELDPSDSVLATSIEESRGQFVLQLPRRERITNAYHLI